MPVGAFLIVTEPLPKETLDRLLPRRRMAVDTKDLIIAKVTDGRAELNPWKDFAWPAIPGHFGPPWFLPLVGAYFRLKDKLA